MKRNPFYKTLQALALLLLALATMASAATGLDTDPDTQELYVNMPVIGMKTVEITADDIANGLTSFMVYDDGGKEDNVSDNADSYLTMIAPKNCVLKVSGSMNYGDVSVFDGNSESTALVSEMSGLKKSFGPYVSSGNVMTLYYIASRGAVGFEFEVSVAPPAYSVTISSETGGEVTSDKAQAIAGETVTLTIAPADGYGFGSLEVMDASNNSVAVVISGNTATFTMPASDVWVWSSWNKPCRVLIGGNHINGNVVSDKAEALAGETVTLTITPADGYELGSLEVMDASNNSVAVEIIGTTATFTMPSWDVTVIPAWNEVYDVTISSVTGGEVNSDKAEALAGETVTLTIAPADGYVLGSIKVEDASDNTVAVDISGNTAIFTMPSSNVTVTPAWNKFYDVTVANVTGGEVIADVATAVEGTSVTLTVSPAKDYMLANLEIKDENQNVVKVVDASSFSNTASFVMPSANVTVTPTWTKTYSAEGGLFVNMPLSGEQNITIPDGVASFKLYDDGGMDGFFSYNADGYLTVTAPEGYVLQMSGTVYRGN